MWVYTDTFVLVCVRMYAAGALFSLILLNFHARFQRFLTPAFILYMYFERVVVCTFATTLCALYTLP